MIFVTVGTHEQAFNRLVEYMDNWARQHEEVVVIQTGYSNYEPKTATWQSMFPYEKMTENVKKARIVITHGGPSSFIMPLQYGKIPIVVPRKKEFKEHVNDHQLSFAKAVEKRQGNIIVVEDVKDLGDAIENYDQKTEALNHGFESHNQEFCEKLEKIVMEVMKQ